MQVLQCPAPTATPVMIFPARYRAIGSRNTVIGILEVLNPVQDQIRKRTFLHWLQVDVFDIYKFEIFIDLSLLCRFLHEDDESMSLVIKNVTSADAGEYLVVASNELGEDSTTMHLIVKAAPKIKKKVENQTCMVSLFSFT